MIVFSEAKITYCEKSAENEVCFKENPYVSAISPEPLPTNVNITMNINEVIEVNEEDQTIKILMKLILIWIDERLFVKRSKEYSDRY